VVAVKPNGFPKHRRHGRGAEEMIVETERVLYVVQRNLVRLTHEVPMKTVDDLPEEMQCYVVGVPWD